METHDPFDYVKKPYQPEIYDSQILSPKDLEEPVDEEQFFKAWRKQENDTKKHRGKKMFHLDAGHDKRLNPVLKDRWITESMSSFSHPILPRQNQPVTFLKKDFDKEDPFRNHQRPNHDEFVQWVHQKHERRVDFDKNGCVCMKSGQQFTMPDDLNVSIDVEPIPRVRTPTPSRKDGSPLGNNRSRFSPKAAKKKSQLVKKNRKSAKRSVNKSDISEPSGSTLKKDLELPDEAILSDKENGGDQSTKKNRPTTGKKNRPESAKVNLPESAKVNRPESAKKNRHATGNRRPESAKVNRLGTAHVRSLPSPQRSSSPSAADLAKRRRMSIRTKPVQKYKKPFHNYGWNNLNPTDDKFYMRSYNLNPQDRSQIMPFMKKRRDRTHSYDAWKEFINIPSDELKRREAEKREERLKLRESFLATNQSTKKEETPLEEENSRKPKCTEESSAPVEGQQNPFFPPELQTPQPHFVLSDRPAHLPQNSRKIPLVRPDWDPRNYRNLPASYIRYIKPAGARTEQGDRAASCLNMYD